MSYSDFQSALNAADNSWAMYQYDDIAVYRLTFIEADVYTYELWAVDENN